MPSAPSRSVRAPAPPSPGEDDLHRRLVQQVEDFAFFFVDPQGTICTWNRGAQRLHDLAPEEAVGRPLAITFPPRDVLDRRPEFVLKVAAADGRFEETSWRARKDGSLFRAEVVVTALRDGDGTLTGFSTFTRDVTKQWLEREAQRQTEERYRLLVESVKDYAIFLLDPGGRVASWNEGAERIKGYRADEIVGEHFSRFFTPEDRERDRPQAELEQALVHGRFEDEGWRVRRDGTRFWANVVVTPLFDLDGSLRGFAKVTRDLTQRRLQEQAQRQHAEDLGVLAADLEAFSYTVAHDLRGPLGGVIEGARLLMEDPGLPEPTRNSLVAAMHASAIRMSRIVEDLLSLSQASHGGLRRTRVDVSAMAREVAERLVREAGLPAKVHVEEGLEADADEGMLRIALENLIGNALKFSSGRPDATVEVGAAQTAQGRAFHVRDNGVGFQMEKATGLFRPFQRLHTAEPFAGTGIGLATVARIVRRHGGSVWARAAPDEGATFYFTLGTQPPQASPTDASREAPADGPKRTASARGPPTRRHQGRSGVPPSHS